METCPNCKGKPRVAKYGKLKCRCGWAKCSGITSTWGSSQDLKLRVQAHKSFDTWWQKAGIHRRRAYIELNHFMGKNTHIGELHVEELSKIIKEFDCRIRNNDYSICSCNNVCNET